MRAEAPVYRTTLPHKQVAWLVTRYEDVLGILKDERIVKDRLNALSSEENAKTPWLPDVFKPLTRNMLDVDEPDHTRLRALVRKAFTPRLIEQLRGRIQMLCDGLLDAVQRKGSMELISDYALPVPDRHCRAAGSSPRRPAQVPSVVYQDRLGLARSRGKP